MMNMTDEKLCEKKMFAKKYTWKKEWVRPYESSFGILLNFCKVNAIGGSKALNLIWKANPEKSYLEIFVPEWYSKQAQFALNLEKVTGEAIMEQYLVYCPKCRENGYHSIFHQLYNMRVCPFHNIPLEYDITRHGTNVIYEQNSIKYEVDMESYSNARNLPHPSLRIEDKTISNYDFCPHKMTNYISSHIFFAVYERGSENKEFKKSTVYPYDFLSDIDSFKCLKIKRFEGREVDLLVKLQTTKHPLSAIRRYEEATSTKCSLMGYWHCYYRQITDIQNLYIYCLFKNLIGCSLDSANFRKTNIKYSDVLHHNNTLKLKLSFIWALKGSWEWQDALSVYWVQHPDSGLNWNYRCIRHGIRLDSLDVSLGIGFSAMDETLVSLYIIDDLFKCLWKQYKALAHRPQGVRVEDGWQELRVPEYYLCTKSETGTMYLYRKKQF